MDGHMDLKRLRRETREDALRIATPVAIPAIVLLVFTAYFYFDPLAGLGILPAFKSSYGVFPNERTWIHLWGMAAPVTGGAIGVYIAAFKILLRTKSGLRSGQQQMHSSVRQGSRAAIDRGGSPSQSNAVG